MILCKIWYTSWISKAYQFLKEESSADFVGCLGLPLSIIYCSEVFIAVVFRYLCFDYLIADQACLISYEIVIWTVEIENKILFQFERLFQVPKSLRFLKNFPFSLAYLAELSFLKFLKIYISKGIVMMFEFSLKKDIILIDSKSNVSIKPIPVYMHILHKPYLEGTFPSHLKLFVWVSCGRCAFHLF